MGALGPTELIIILLIVLLLFGAKKLPELARGLGRGIREFKDATNEITDEISKSDYDRTHEADRTRQSASSANQTSAPAGDDNTQSDDVEGEKE